MVENKEPEIIENGSTKKLNKCGLVSFIFSLVGIIIAGLPLWNSCYNYRYYRNCHF